ITVVRHGKVVGEAEPTASDNELASLMVGRAVQLTVDKQAARPRENELAVRNLVVARQDGQVVVDDLSFTVHGGEILVVAGVQGNGQTELTEALLGLHPGGSGSISLDGNELRGRSVRQILDAGVGFVPEDRSTDGLVGEFTIAENLILDRTAGPPFVRAGSLQLAARDEFAREKVNEYDVRTIGIDLPVGRLSGGNQQDRKSTRLNSSHVKISYAVFCL